MKLSTKLIAGAVIGLATAAAGGVAAAVNVPTVPQEQQQLLNVGFVQTASWGKFEKQDGQCQITVMLSGKNYYAYTNGKLHATLYPIIPSQVVAAATLLDANCQG
ncbi:MAG TPA: hypothetical protein VJP80_06625 [Candidatus Saccharimonadales bacterium]|nr:hypothetical protein [Candidatus Saccharimonadales bacterium]